MVLNRTHKNLELLSYMEDAAAQSKVSMCVLVGEFASRCRDPTCPCGKALRSYNGL